MYDTTKPYKTRILDAVRSTWFPNAPIGAPEAICTYDAKIYHLTGMPYPFVRHRDIESGGGCGMIEVDHTDGIGTKGMLHAQTRFWSYAAQDALAMNLNDLLMVNAKAYKLQNHLMMQYDSHDDIVKIIEELAALCRKYGIAMTGGETSIMDNLNGMDLSCTVTGTVRSNQPCLMETGDVLIGLPSNGPHSNGYTAIRFYFGSVPHHEFIQPTTIYWDKVYPLMDDYHAAIHIAGGGFTRLKDHMQPDQSVKINRYKTRHPAFDKIFKQANAPFYEANGKHLTDEKMYSTFNCGIGMILSVAPEKVETFAHLGCEVIGEVGSGDGSQITIESIFSDSVLTYNGKEGKWTKNT